MSREKLQLTLEETAYFFESATLYLRALCETQMPGAGGYGQRDGLEFQLPSGHIEIAGAGWVHMQLDTLLPHCRYMPATWLTDTVRQLLTAYTQHTNFRLYFKQMLLVIDEHSDVDGRHVFDQDNKGWKAVSNALKGLVIDDDDQYHLSVHMMSSRSAENVCHISLVLPESQKGFSNFTRRDLHIVPWSHRLRCVHRLLFNLFEPLRNPMGQAACNFTLLCNLKHSADGKKPASTATHRSIREKHAEAPKLWLRRNRRKRSFGASQENGSCHDFYDPRP